MSKTDDLRAMREAKYARAAAHRGRQPQAGPPTPVAPVAPEPTPQPTAEPEAEPSGLCGHRSMNGRTCTREAGHAAKSHRYS